MTMATPLRVSGRFIVDAAGKRVKLCGANWAGAHQDPMVPGGLDYRPRGEIAAQLAGWGFNSVRLTFALSTVTAAAPVPPALVSANPDLRGRTPWQVYQACVQALTGAGLMVIPNCHLLFRGWCCSESDGNGLWWNSNWPPSAFTNGWLTVAAAFASTPLVIGYDLKNEPRKATIGGTVYTPSWGDGNAQTDFRQLYSSTASRIEAVDPGALFFCEGLSYAGDLTAAGAHPVSPAKPGRSCTRCTTTRGTTLRAVAGRLHHLDERQGRLTGCSRRTGGGPPAGRCSGSCSRSCPPPWAPAPRRERCSRRRRACPGRRVSPACVRPCI